MKVRVLRAMPGANDGDIFEVKEDDGGVDYIEAGVVKYFICPLINNRWLEIVKEEKTLEEIFKTILIHSTMIEEAECCTRAKDMMNEAREYFLEVLDKTIKEYSNNPFNKFLPKFMRKRFESVK